jgi:hypothetical protein
MIRQRSGGRYTLWQNASVSHAQALNRVRSSRQPISVEFRRVLLIEMNANTWAPIMDDKPGEFSNQINGTYPEERPLSTVPANVLAVLPRLPDDIQYRFVGRHLILLDTRAGVILDRVPYAINCADCDKVTWRR